MNKFLRRIVYFCYYLRKLDINRLSRFMWYVKSVNGWSYFYQWQMIIRDSLLFNISILEYYQFRFFELSDSEKSTWAGTGTMYEFQRRANPPKYRFVLEDKGKFHEAYKSFFRHEVYTRSELEQDASLCKAFLDRNRQLVFKPATGNCGVGIVFLRSDRFSTDNLVKWMYDNKFDLVESRVEQHRSLNVLSPSGVNTVRIFTCLDSQDRCQIIGCRLRISVNSPVDNMAAGNLAAPIDEMTGVVCGRGFYSDITRIPESVHPVTGVPIEGFQIPFWNETLKMIREASECLQQNRSIGWDIVITPDGPGLIEGNHDWCKLVWQLPVGRGLKELLPSEYLS